MLEVEEMYAELTFENCEYSRDPILGCALEGVASVIAGIKDASIVIHSPQDAQLQFLPPMMRAKLILRSEK